MVKNIKIYGERNTGTNYLQQLIKLNFNVNILRGVTPFYFFRPALIAQCMMPALFKEYPLPEQSEDIYFKLTSSKNLGWKHTFISSSLMEDVKPQKNDISFMTLTKNPYSWLLSLHKRPYSYSSYDEIPDFKQFLTKSWKTLKRENHLESFENPIVMWNEKNKSYMQLKSNFPTMNIRYEDILLDPEVVIDNTSERFNITKKYETFKNLEKSTKGDKKDFSYYQNYYLNELWKEKLNDEAVDIINKYLDEDVMNYFGYKKLE